MPWLGYSSTIFETMLSVTPYRKGGGGLSNSCPNWQVLQGGWHPVGDHEVLFSQFPCGNWSAKIGPMFVY